MLHYHQDGPNPVAYFDAFATALQHVNGSMWFDADDTANVVECELSNVLNMLPEPTPPTTHTQDPANPKYAHAVHVLPGQSTVLRHCAGMWIPPEVVNADLYGFASVPLEAVGAFLPLKGGDK